MQQIAYCSGKGDDDSLPLESLITDRGWAWAVLFASFFCYMVADGWSYSLPELKEELQKDFNSTESITSMIGWSSLEIGCLYIIEGCILYLIIYYILSHIYIYIYIISRYI